MMTQSEATTEANRVLARMHKPNVWRIAVWNNFGWHWHLKHDPSDGLLTLCNGKDGTFFAMLSLEHPGCGDCAWSNHRTFTDPNRAVAHTLKMAKAVMKKRNDNFKRVMSSIDTAV